MIDHILGRPSTKFRKVQVIWVIAFWLVYIAKGNRHGPPVVRNISSFITRRLNPTFWQSIVSTMLYLYFARNFSKVFDLESPEPLAGMYSRSYFRATYVLTALDAGFWTAMKIRNERLRNLCSILFSLYYLIAAEAGDEKVRRIRACITIEHLRVSWNKGTTPYIKALTNFLHPNPNLYPPIHIKLERPQESYYSDPIEAVLYFEGTREELLNASEILLDYPGGGFVAMSPRHHDDKLFYWSRKLKIPILSVDYKKAPEYPYPFALHECYDVYAALVNTRGKCIGLSGKKRPRIVLVGDSAGGNLAAGVTLMILDTMHGTSPEGETTKFDKRGRRHRRSFSRKELPMPHGLIFIYPCMDMNITSWMSEEQMNLIKSRSQNKHTDTPSPKSVSTTSTRSTTPSPFRTPKPLPTKSPIVPPPLRPLTTPSPATSTLHMAAHALLNAKPAAHTSLAMTSRISYFSDRILSPEMMRAMVLLYLGPNLRPDFSKEYLLSPVVAPESHLALFPKTYFLTGERDPLVDDTILLAGRISEAKRRAAPLGAAYREDDHIEVRLVRGASHGFLMMQGVYSGFSKEMDKVVGWVQDLFKEGEKEEGYAARMRAGWGVDGDLLGRRMGRLAAGVVGESRSRTRGGGDWIV